MVALPCHTLRWRGKEGVGGGMHFANASTIC
jgi:hypothetical protein